MEGNHDGGELSRLTAQQGEKPEDNMEDGDKG
jgi:hypothetical protein